MALISMLFASIFLGILVILFILSIISLILCIIFTILSITDKTKKSRKILTAVFGSFAVLFFIPILLTTMFLKSKTKEIIYYEGKNYSIEKEIIDKFYLEISCGDIEEVDKYLQEYPELINSKDYEGSLPLGHSIKFKELDCIKYFVEKNVDINTVSSNSEFGTLEYMFYYNYYNEDILEYILMQDNLDVNKRHLAMPVAQLYIKSIIKDKEISDKELELFEKLLSKGLDLNLTNGTNTNTYDYAKYNVSDDVANIDKLRNLIDK